MVLHNLFPTTIYVDHISVSEDILTAAEKEPLFRNNHDNGWVSEVKKHRDQKYSPLLALINDHVNQYAAQVNIGFNLSCCGAWINVHTLNDKAQEHYHPLSLISGVVYLNVPENSGSLLFHADKRALHSFGPFFQTEDQCVYALPVKQGTLVLFPSVLLHSTEPNQTSNARCSFAFDYAPEGFLQTSLNSIKIST